MNLLYVELFHWQSLEFMNIMPSGIAHAFDHSLLLLTTMAAKKTAQKSAKAPAAAITPKAAKKTVTKKAATKTAKKAAPKAAKTPAPTFDDIARAAYLIYRRRTELGLPGNSGSDWAEAERELGVSA
jgi:hypothetical protein